MENPYQENAKILKALSDPNRLRIIDMLSCGEKCICNMLKEFKLTQPTLSHHMKVLSDCGLLESRKEGLWHYYSLNEENYKKMSDFLTAIGKSKEDCICNNKNC